MCCLRELGAAIKYPIGAGRLGGGWTVVSTEDGGGGGRRLKLVFCCSAGEETSGLDLEGSREW